MTDSLPQWSIFFKLRNNIALDGDLELARREIQKLIDQLIEPATKEHLQMWLHCGWILPKDATLQREGIVGYVCDVDTVDFLSLFWRLSFCEQVFVVAPDTDNFSIRPR